MKQFTLTMSLVAATFFAVPSTTFAQDTPAGDRPQRPEGARRMDPEARLKFMTEKLGLDADQQAKIKAIYEKNGPKMKELMAKGRENLTDADKTAMRDLMKSQTEEINAVLTPEQQEKMKAMRPQGRRGEKPAEPKPATETK
jgi:Spy/CpxP family protein refolding chaperone